MLDWRYPDKPIECGPEFVMGLNEPEWVAQGKYDGWRTQVYIDNDCVPHLFTRVGKLLTSTSANAPSALLEAVAHICKNIPANSVLDSEFVGPRGGHDPRLFLFDVLAWDDLWLGQKTLDFRREILLNVRGVEPHDADAYVVFAETVESDFLGYFHRLRQVWYDGGCSTLDLHEGIVLKRRTGKMTLDRNNSVKSSHMYKLKYRDILARRY